jgi:cellulose biosynthesis protein BcsQ
MTGKVISVVNRKGGVGKTTLAIAVADAFVSEWRANVLLVDLDPQATASQALLSPADFENRTTNDKNIIALLAAEMEGRSLERADYCERMCHRITNRGDVDLALFPNSDRFWDLETDAISKGRTGELHGAVKRILGHEADAGSIVIVDCPPGQSVSALAAIRASHMVLCPITPDRFAIWGKDLLANYILRNAPGVNPTFIVTRARRGTTEARRALEQLMGARQMLKVHTGRQTAGAPDTLATFSEAQDVRRRVHMTRDLTLRQIYGEKCSSELARITTAIRRELTLHG